MLIQPPEPTGNAFPLRSPSRLDSTCTYPTGTHGLKNIQGSRWKKAYPKAVACLKKDFDQLLSFFQIKNPQLYSRLRTTNLIERAFREVRRRTRPMGVMAHTQSLERIVFAVFHHLNQNWSQRNLKFTHNS
jgi:transposase-like protein